MQIKLFIVVNNRRGSVINVALLILILIFLIGIGLSKISTTDIKIAGNMKTEASAFYAAEAGLDAAAEMIEQNLLCANGFTEETINGYFTVNPDHLDFSYNTRDKASIPSSDSSDADFYYPVGYGENDPHTNIKLGAVSRYARGSAIQMAAGYEGLGKGAASGGGSLIFDVYAQRLGLNNSTATNFMQWSHISGLFGSSGGCNY